MDPTTPMPTMDPTTPTPTMDPTTSSPTDSPTTGPTPMPTAAPVTSDPTNSPTTSPTLMPTTSPTAAQVAPTASTTQAPVNDPTVKLTLTFDNLSEQDWTEETQDTIKSVLVASFGGFQKSDVTLKRTSVNLRRRLAASEVEASIITDSTEAATDLESTINQYDITRLKIDIEAALSQIGVDATLESETLAVAVLEPEPSESEDDSDSSLVIIIAIGVAVIVLLIGGICYYSSQKDDGKQKEEDVEEIELPVQQTSAKRDPSTPRETPGGDDEGEGAQTETDGGAALPDDLDEEEGAETTTTGIKRDPSVHA